MLRSQLTHAAGTLWPSKSQLSASDRQYLPHLLVSAMETGPIRPFWGTRHAIRDTKPPCRIEAQEIDSTPLQPTEQSALTPRDTRHVARFKQHATIITRNGSRTRDIAHATRATCFIARDN